MQVLDWHFSLEPVQGFSSLRIKILKISNPNVIRVVTRIHAKVSIYLIFAAKDEKTRTDMFWSRYYALLMVESMDVIRLQHAEDAKTVLGADQEAVSMEEAIHMEWIMRTGA